jgi:hypothetical protein
LAKSLVEKLDAVHLTTSSILQSILDGNENNLLYDTVFIILILDKIRIRARQSIER